MRNEFPYENETSFSGNVERVNWQKSDKLPKFTFIMLLKGTVVQIKKELINDRLRVSKVS